MPTMNPTTYYLAPGLAALPSASQVSWFFGWFWRYFWAVAVAAAYSGYLFNLPGLAEHFNNVYHDNPVNRGHMGPLCTLSPQTPGLECANGQDLRELAKAMNRTWICGCTQGLLGDVICPLDVSFSVSYFINSVTAVGLLLTLSYFPFRNIWWYQEWLERNMQPTDAQAQTAFWSLFIFQVFYGLALSFPSCFLFRSHYASLFGMALAFSTHMAMNLFILFRRNQEIPSLIIIVAFLIMTIAMLGVLVSYSADCGKYFWLCTWGPWFFESLFLSVIVFIPPLLMIFGRVDLPMPKLIVEPVETALG